MKSILKEILFPGFIFLLSYSLNIQTANGQICITHVNIVDPVHQQIEPDETVIISGSVIDSVGPASEISVPLNAQVLDGKGKFLMPSMTDGDVQLSFSGGWCSRPDLTKLSSGNSYASEITPTRQSLQDILRRYLRVGVTTILDLGTPPSSYERLDSLSGGSLGPDIYMTGPVLGTPTTSFPHRISINSPYSEVRSPKEVPQRISELMLMHPRFITVCADLEGDSLGRKDPDFFPTLRAIITQCHEHHLKVVVQTHQESVAALAVQTGCNYLVGEIEDHEVSDSLINLIKRHHVEVCPVINLTDNFYSAIDGGRTFSTYELSIANPEIVESLSERMGYSTIASAPGNSSLVPPEDMATALIHADSIAKLNLKKMADAGISIISGSGAGHLGTEHAGSYLKALKEMKACGLSNWQVIRAATFKPSGLALESGKPGSIVPGYRADLLLLDGNPADRLRNLEQISVVFHKGQMIRVDTLISESPQELVQRQVNGYNYGNIKAFMEPYAQNIRLYQFPDLLLSTGKDAIRTRMEYLLKNFRTCIAKSLKG